MLSQVQDDVDDIISMMNDRSEASWPALEVAAPIPGRPDADSKSSSNRQDTDEGGGALPQLITFSSTSR